MPSKGIIATVICTCSISELSLTLPAPSMVHGPTEKQSRVLASDKRGIRRSVSVQNTRQIGDACGLIIVSVARKIPKLDPSCEMCFQKKNSNGTFG